MDENIFPIRLVEDVQINDYESIEVDVDIKKDTNTELTSEKIKNEKVKIYHIQLHFQKH